MLPARFSGGEFRLPQPMGLVGLQETPAWIQRQGAASSWGAFRRHVPAGKFSPRF